MPGRTRETGTGHRAIRRGTSPRGSWLCFVLLTNIVCASCFSGERGETFYGRVPERLKPELRWSDGELPRVFDPALAAAAPDTDAVRALFEGLTELDPRTLAATPAVAERWQPNEDNSVWTFRLRADARWSNGDQVTANDFVRSWRRAINLGERVPHRALLANIQGAPARPPAAIEEVEDANAVSNGGASKIATPTNADAPDAAPAHNVTQAQQNAGAPLRTLPETPAAVADEVTSDDIATHGVAPANQSASITRQPPPSTSTPPDFGVEAIAPDVLRVRLIEPDPDFPALVAHTVFRPLHRVDSSRAVTAPGDVSAPITNGAFNLVSRSESETVLGRAATYWDAAAVQLEIVRFIRAPDTETKLALYRAGEVDVVGNAAFEPLAIKLLAPHEDFRRTTFGALNYYVFNPAVAEFTDRRVREAFALAVDRERLVRDTLGGASQPAYTFLPDGGAMLTDDRTARATSANEKLLPLRLDRRRARQLLAEAGFPGGRGFPEVRLLVNRNETHKTIANVVAAMWRDALGVRVEVVIKDRSEFDFALASGDYTIARRGYVMQTPTARHTIAALFYSSPAESSNAANSAPESESVSTPADDLDSDPPSSTFTGETEKQKDAPAKDAFAKDAPAAEPASPVAVSEKTAAQPRVLSHVQAMRELPGIPLYFASANTLVKPYVLNFDGNVFDAPSLKRVRIDTRWTPPDAGKIVEVERP